MWLIYLMLAQDIHTPAAKIRAAMEASLAKQRASVQLQARAAENMHASPPQTTSFSLGTSVPLPHAECEPVAAPELSKMIETVATENAIDPALVREVARQESGFRPCAVSPAGAQGLMQLMPSTQAQLEVQNPFDPQESLSAGARLLKQLLERYAGNLPLALSAYNAGAGRVDKAAGIPHIPETMNYVEDILGRLKP